MFLNFFCVQEESDNCMENFSIDPDVPMENFPEFPSNLVIHPVESFCYQLRQDRRSFSVSGPRDLPREPWWDPTVSLSPFLLVLFFFTIVLVGNELKPVLSDWHGWCVACCHGHSSRRCGQRGRVPSQQSARRGRFWGFYFDSVLPVGVPRSVRQGAQVPRHSRQENHFALWKDSSEVKLVKLTLINFTCPDEIGEDLVNALYKVNSVSCCGVTLLLWKILLYYEGLISINLWNIINSDSDCEDTFRDFLLFKNKEINFFLFY